MSEQNIFPKVKLRGFGEYYGEIIEGEILAVLNGNVVKIRYYPKKDSEGLIGDFNVHCGFDDDHLFHPPTDYSGFQLDVEGLIFDKSIKGMLEV